MNAVRRLDPRIKIRYVPYRGYWEVYTFLTHTNHSPAGWRWFICDQETFEDYRRRGAPVVANRLELEEDHAAR